MVWGIHSICYVHRSQRMPANRKWLSPWVLVLLGVSGLVQAQGSAQLLGNLGMSPLLSSYKMLLSGLPTPHFLTFWGASGASVVGGDLLVALVGNATPLPWLTVSPPPLPLPSHQSEAGTSALPEGLVGTI